MVDSVKFGKTGFSPDQLRVVDYLHAQAWALATGAPLTQPLAEGVDYVHLAGSIEKAKIRPVMDEKSRLEPILVETDRLEDEYPGKKLFVICSSFRPTEPQGLDTVHPFEMLWQVIGEAYDGTYGSWRRCSEVIRQLWCGGNAFSKAGDVVVDLPVGVLTGLRNGGFELDFYRWTQNSSVIDTGTVHGGSKSSKLAASGANVNGCESELIAVDAGKLHKLSAWINVSALTKGDFIVRIRAYDAAQALISTIYEITETATTGGWVERTRTIGPSGQSTFPAGTRYVKIDTRWYNATSDPTGTAYVDDLSFDLNALTSKCTEYVSFTRLTSDGAIPFVLGPQLPVVNYDVAEEDLAKGNPLIAKDAYGQIIASTQNIRLTSQGAQQSNPGRWLLECYDGASWLTIGSLAFAAKSLSKDLHYFEDKPSLAEIQFNRKVKQRESIRFTYPSAGGSPAKKYKIAGHLFVLRGRPFMPSEIQNWGGPLVEARCKINISRTDLRYYTRAGSTLDAVGTVYGENLQAGDADDSNVFFLSDEASPSKTALQVGFICLKKVDRDYRAYDAGNYWSSIELTWDNVYVDERGLPFPLFIIFAQRQGSAGNRTPAQLGDEAVVNLFTPQWVSEVV